jgi:hypothetical protein
MFYVKTRINEETDLTTDITEENVFTRCPDCGAELRVDLPELAPTRILTFRHGSAARHAAAGAGRRRIKMKQLIPMDKYGVFADMRDTPRADSRFVAEFFEKEHKNVLRDIDAILRPDSGYSAEFGRLNFEPISYPTPMAENSAVTL